MSRALSGLALLVIPTLLPAAPAAKGKVVYYHPTKVGDTRLYEETGKDFARRITAEVTKVEKTDGALEVAETRTAVLNGDQVTGFRTVAVSAAGVTDLSRGTDHVLRLPAKAGESWTFQSGAANEVPDHKAIYTTGKEEEVEVPAGKFKAVRVDSETFRNGERESKSSDWYAPEVGLVKSVTTMGGSDRTLVLKSFTPGK
jgi:hypothetical protein